jgi:hypothetical protein
MDCDDFTFFSGVGGCLLVDIGKSNTNGTFFGKG